MPGADDGSSDAVLPPEIPEWTRRYDVERRESVSVLRGLGFCVLFSLPVVALIVAGAIWVSSLLR